MLRPLAPVLFERLQFVNPEAKPLCRLGQPVALEGRVSGNVRPLIRRRFSFSSAKRLLP
jgi:hypothetical protein